MARSRGDAVFKAELLTFTAGGVAALVETRGRGCRDDEREGKRQAGFPQGESCCDLIGSTV